MMKLIHWLNVMSSVNTESTTRGSMTAPLVTVNLFATDGRQEVHVAAALSESTQIPSLVSLLSCHLVYSSHCKVSVVLPFVHLILYVPDIGVRTCTVIESRV